MKKSENGNDRISWWMCYFDIWLKRKIFSRISPAVQWLRLPLNAGGMCLIPGQGTKILHQNTFFSKVFSSLSRILTTYQDDSQLFSEHFFLNFKMLFSLFFFFSGVHWIEGWEFIRQYWHGEQKGKQGLLIGKCKDVLVYEPVHWYSFLWFQ